MALAVLILFDMLLLALEIWFSATWMLVTAALCTVFLMIRGLFGTLPMVHVALGIAGISAVFILSQAGQSAWGSNLMLYLLPVQIANAAAVGTAFAVGALWRVRP